MNEMKLTNFFNGGIAKYSDTFNIHSNTNDFIGRFSGLMLKALAYHRRTVHWQQFTGGEQHSKLWLPQL
jgi:hypothetical protein